MKIEDLVLIIDIFLRDVKQGYENYKIITDKFTLSHSNGNYILMTKDDCFEERNLANIFWNIPKDYKIKRIVTGEKIIDYYNLLSLIEPFGLNLVLSFDSCDVFYNGKKFFRPIINLKEGSFSEGGIENIIETTYDKLEENINSKLRYILVKR